MNTNNQNRHQLLVDAVFNGLKKGNQNRNCRVNEIRRVADEVTLQHGSIPRLGMILRKLPENLFHAYDLDRNSFGYKETTEKLKATINEVMGKSIFPNVKK